MGEWVESLRNQLDRQSSLRVRAIEFIPSSAVLAAIVGIFIFMFAQCKQIDERLDRVDARLNRVLAGVSRLGA